MSSSELAKDKLLGLGTVVPRRMGSILFGKLPPYDQLMEKLLEEVKNKPAQWAEVHAVFLVVLEELNYNKSPCVRVFTDSWVVANDPGMWAGRWAMETALLKNWVIL